MPQRRLLERPLTAIFAARRARLRNLVLSGLATAGVAAGAVALVPSSASAAEMPQAAHTVHAVSHRAPQTATGASGSLDGWIKQSLAIMKAKGIPGSYDGLKRNIMRESGGNPNAQNNWDVNAQKGIPSKGLLQVIDPTFNAYHVAGTAHSVTDPVANITAAANYAAHRYGSIDNVNSAY
ncbi:transglycosylase SLT domain-containing protein [Streptomyces sp. NPDC048242]|uniref:transglycosylase SLT domain-containing protein n=1 Tax=Streptomyces sp. NPDC048242 TaxID=3155026 RepID=UPI0034314611